MEFRKDRAIQIAIVSLMMLGFVYIFTGSSESIPYPLLFQTRNSQLCDGKTTQDTTTSLRGDDELSEALAKASTTGTNKTVIIAVVNKAYVEGDKPLLDIFLDGFWIGEGTRGLVEHLLLVAMDRTSYERCKFLRLHCYLLGAGKEGDDEATKEHLFMSSGFNKMMWQRTLFLGEVLRRGYSFIFTDVDVMWLRNPFPRLSQDETLDLQISSDKKNEDPGSRASHVNTGFYMIRSNNRTIALFDTWYARRNSSGGMKEQDVLEHMMHEGVLPRLGISIRFLDGVHFSGFCEKVRHEMVVVTVHADCCRTIRAKVTDLMEVIHDWKRFRVNMTTPFTWSEPLACRSSWG